MNKEENEIILDGHCDALAPFTQPGKPPVLRDLTKRSVDGHVDIPRLREGGVDCQVMAIYADECCTDDYTAFTHSHLDVLEKMMECDSAFKQVLKSDEIYRFKQNGKLCFLAGIEDGKAIKNSTDELLAFYNRGVRIMTLTWNNRNSIGRGNGSPGSDGLTEFGIKVVKSMEKMGMLVDVSHMADTTLNDVLDIAEKPIIASHSNAKAIVNHERNLDDWMIERIAETDGLICANFVPYFLSNNPDADMMEALISHIDHIVQIAGIDHAGIGSDFDGFDPALNCPLKDVSVYHTLQKILSSGKWKKEGMLKIMGGNWMRVLKKTIG